MTTLPLESLATSVCSESVHIPDVAEKRSVNIFLQNKFKLKKVTCQQDGQLRQPISSTGFCKGNH